MSENDKSPEQIFVDFARAQVIDNAKAVADSITPDCPAIRVARAFADCLIATGEVATWDQIVSRTGVTDPAYLADGAAIWNSFVESLDEPLDEPLDKKPRKKAAKKRPKAKAA